MVIKVSLERQIGNSRMLASIEVREVSVLDIPETAQRLLDVLDHWDEKETVPNEVDGGKITITPEVIIR